MEQARVDGSLNDTLIGQNFFADHFGRQDTFGMAEKKFFKVRAGYFEGRDRNGVSLMLQMAFRCTCLCEFNIIECDRIKN